MAPRLAFAIGLSALVALSLPVSTLSAQAQYGTEQEARAMLEKAVVALKANKENALEMFNKGEGGFKDRDLYVWCANASDGVLTAHPNLKGELLQDIVGKARHSGLGNLINGGSGSLDTLRQHAGDIASGVGKVSGGVANVGVSAFGAVTLFFSVLFGFTGPIFLSCVPPFPRLLHLFTHFHLLFWKTSASSRSSSPSSSASTASQPSSASKFSATRQGSS